MDLYQRWLEGDTGAPTKASPEDWLEAWIQLGEEALRDAPASPTATPVLASDRNRLERG